MKNAIFRDVAQCGFIVNRRFGERVASIFGLEEISPFSALTVVTFCGYDAIL
jgi:hypothetical protein